MVEKFNNETAWNANAVNLDFNRDGLDNGLITPCSLDIALNPPRQKINEIIDVINNSLLENEAILSSHDYQYVYDWTSLPNGSYHKWNNVVQANAISTISDGILHMQVDSGEYINYYRETGDIKKSDTVIIEHRCKITQSNYNPFCMIFMLTESEETTSGSGNYKAYLLSGKDGILYIAGGTETLTLDIDEYHTYTLIKYKNEYYYLFIDGELVSKLSWSNIPTVSSSAYYEGRNLVFGPYYGSSVYSGEMYSEYFKYSKLREGSKELNGTSSKIVGGNIDIKNQAENEGIQIQSNKITSTGTNQDINIEPDGTGNVNITNNSLEMNGVEVIDENRKGTFTAIDSPDIKALLASIHFEYVYYWTGIASSMRFPFNISFNLGTFTETYSSGTLTYTTTSDDGRTVKASYYEAAQGLLPEDTVYIEHTFNVASSVNHKASIANIIDDTDVGGYTYRSVLVQADDTGLYLSDGVSVYTKIHSDDYTVDKTVTIIKDSDKMVYIFVDGILVYSCAYSALPNAPAGTVAYGSNQICFGVNFAPLISTAGSSVVFNSKVFKYTILRSTVRRITGSLLRLEDDTNSIELSTSGLASKGTNQDINIEPNGTGNVNILKDLSGKTIISDATTDENFLIARMSPDTSDQGGLIIDQNTTYRTRLTTQGTGSASGYTYLKYENASSKDSGTGTFHFQGYSNLYTNGNIIWHGGNDGSGSGLEADLLDGKHASEFAGKTTNTVLGSTLTDYNWYRIASNGPVQSGTGGSRASAKFTVLSEASGGYHQSITFYASIEYGANPSITLLNCSNYSSLFNITKIRLVHGSTYDGAAIEVYVSIINGGSFKSEISENIHTSGWTPVNWELGEVPSGFVTTEVDISTNNALMSVSASQQNIFELTRSGNLNINGNITTNENVTANGLISPDIKALLASHDYQYTYGWNNYPSLSEHKWNQLIQGATHNYSNGEYSADANPTTGTDYVINYRTIPEFTKNSTLIAKHRIKITRASTALTGPIFHITDQTDHGATYNSTYPYKKFLLSGYPSDNGIYTYDSSRGGTIKIATVDDVTDFNDYEVIRTPEGAHIFINDQYIDYVAYENFLYGSYVYGQYRNITIQSCYSSSTESCAFVSDSFQYSIINDNEKKIVGTSSKIIGGNIDVKNQAETEGIQIQSDKITSTGTNQDLNIEPNGTGEIICNSNLNGKIIEGGIVYKYDEATTSTYLIPDDVGTIHANTYANNNNVNIQLPDANTHKGRDLFIDAWSYSAEKIVTITCSDSTDRIAHQTSLYTTYTLNSTNQWIHLKATYSSRWRVVNYYGGTFS